MSNGAVILVRAEPTERELAWSLASVPGVDKVERIEGTYQFIVWARSDAVDDLKALPGVRDTDVCWMPNATGSVIPHERDDLEKKIAELETDLRSRTVIGQATGLVMAHKGVSSSDAFGWLVHRSRAANRKLRDMAKEYVEAWDEHLDMQFPDRQ